MTYLAFRNLFQQKLRLTLSVGGVALSITLIILLNGFLEGVYAQVTAYLIGLSSVLTALPETLPRPQPRMAMHRRTRSLDAVPPRA